MTAERQPDPPSIAALFLSFLRLGATAFGGPAMVAHIRKLVIDKKRWIDGETFRNGLALCQTIPGATAMQTCAYVGLRLRGVPGAAASFIGFALPAFLFMVALSALYLGFHSVAAVALVFEGLRALIVAIVAHAAYVFGRSYLKTWQDFLVAPIAAVMFWFGISPILVVLSSAALGIALRYRRTASPATPEIGHDRLAILSLSIILGAAAAFLLTSFLVDRRVFDLSLLMMRVDLFAFGGGFASVPLMLHEVVDVRHWMDPKTFMDGITLGQVTPGPIVITSTFVGYVLQGPLGAVVATASIFLPSFIMVLVTSPFIARLNGLPIFRKAIDGVLCSFVGLLLSAAVRLGFAVAWDVPRVILACVALAALILRVDLLWVILAGIGASLFLR